MMIKPTITRQGTNYEVQIGEISAVFIINRDPTSGRLLEVFGKANGGMQGHLDASCTLISLVLQERATLPIMLQHMIFDKTAPQGGPGQPTSIYDALARVLMKEEGLVLDHGRVSEPTPPRVPEQEFTAPQEESFIHSRLPKEGYASVDTPYRLSRKNKEWTA